MEKVIGNKPTSDQKRMVSLNKKLLHQAQAMVLASDEKVLKAIQVDILKLNNQKTTGILMLSTNEILFVSSNDHWRYKYQNVSHFSLRTIDKEKEKKQLHNQNLVIEFGYLNSEIFNFNKNEDTQEFIEILTLKKNNPNQEVLTTVAHNFDYFLHADRLKELRKHNIKTTFFLMKQDDMNYSKNGRRLLQERHKGATLIVEGYYNKKKKINHFIVVDKNVFVYEYDNEDRKAKLLNNWPLVFFSGSEIDHFAFKTEVKTSESILVLNGSGKKFEEILSNAKIPFKNKKRKMHQKVIGFRSDKLWKKSIASIAYALILLMVFIMIFGKDTLEQESFKESSTLISNEKNEVKVVSIGSQKEIEAQLAEKERIGEEKRVAEEARKVEEARVAEKSRKAEEVRVAKEQQQAASYVFYKNCTAVRTAGADPIRAGEPGYSRKLDRDGDGIACE